MRLISLFLIPTLLQSLSAEFHEYYEDIPDDLVGQNANYTVNETDAKTHAEIRETLQHFHECRDKEWSCDKHCRLEFRRETQKCHHPAPGDNCFGIPITYKYSRDFVAESRFLRELGVLSRYPRCWSYLAPLVCATIFRPCSRHYFIEKSKEGKVVNGTIELWQLLGSSSCKAAQAMCADVISAGLFPSFIKCEEVRDKTTQNVGKTRIVYSNTCQHRSDEFPVQVGPGACPWPLVSESGSVHSDVSPVLDSCYLPCRSPLVSSSLSSRFRSLRFVLCVFLAIFFVAESVYLSRFSKIFTESLLVFYVSHAVISIAVYCFIWSLSLFDYFFTLSNCSIDGTSRRDALSHSLFEWCSLQAILLYASFLAAFLWLFLLYINTVCPSSFFSLYYSSRPFKIRARPFLVLCVYGLSTITSLVVMSSLRENDGVSGVCYNGLLTWWKYLIAISPLLWLFLLTVSLGFLVIVRKEVFLKSLASKHALREPNKVDNQEHHAGITKLENNSSVTEADGHVCPVRNTLDKRENDSLLLPNGLQQKFDCQFCTSYRSLSRRLSYERNFGVSSTWTGASFALIVLFLIGSPVIHFMYVGVSDGQEVTSVVDYINCGSAHAIKNRSLAWTANSDFPSPALHEAPWCSLPLERARGRLEGILIVFIILPVLPFVVLLVAFLAGINGYGGMSKVRISRGDSSVFSKLFSGEEEYCELAPVKSFLSGSGEANEGEIPGGVTSSPEEGVTSSKLGSASFSKNIDETENTAEIVDYDKTTNSEGPTDVTGDDRESQEEYREEFLKIINQLRGELAFQQSMLINDGAAWNICLHYMQRTEQLLSHAATPSKPADGFTRDLLALGEEMSRVLPSVSDHAMQLSRWMNSVQEACLKLEHIRSAPTDEQQSYFDSQDISRQQQLLALNEYIMRAVASTAARQSACPANPGKTAVQPEDTAQEAQQEQQQRQSTSKEEQVKQKEVQESSTKRQENAKEPNPQCDQQPGPSHRIQHDARPAPPPPSGCPGPGPGPSGSENSASGVREQSGRPRPLLRISAYAESYCATPRGILTRLTIPELRIRVQQIKNICAGDSLYPQELSYMLLVTGDIIFGGNRPREDLFLYTAEQLPVIFGTNSPSIDARIGVQDFLSQMRRRALCVVAAIGYHYSLDSRRGLDYTPPVLPPLGLYRSENELVLRRVLGDRDDVLPSLRDFLQEFQFGRGPVQPRPDLKFAAAFRNYLRLVAAREGFNSDNLEEDVPDPEPRQEQFNPVDEMTSSDEPDEVDVEGPAPPM
ncbi:hypothetical protein Y032_0186g1082 [Ancylostoma ceylanicum]|uniref:FZ domain-containing protein n=1 Tax=Ancylostoma ceylanicum TaxID=53326 RepID=A0A016SS26_9BILA|nr:hypothetical protein Y032_0186g1082 [Ancylostoma ceylanicum]